MSETALDQLIDCVILSLYKTDQINKICTGQSGSTLSDSDFLEFRCIDSGAPHVLFFVFIGTQNQLTDELKDDQSYLGLNKEAGRHATLINDLYSLKKEIRDECYKFNYVYVKMSNNKISADEAVDKIIGEINESEKMARVHGERLKEKNESNLSRYVDGVYDVMAGNHYWSTICKRYN